MQNKYKEAFRSAEQEIEEKSVEQLKTIIKSLLQKKKDKEEERDELDDEIKLIKQDIEDFKAGRLDKIKERHETDEKCNRIFPLNIQIVQDNRYYNNPLKPWVWTYAVYPYYGAVVGTNAVCTVTDCNSLTLTGGTSATFTSGAYTVSSSTGTNIINL